MRLRQCWQHKIFVLLFLFRIPWQPVSGTWDYETNISQTTSFSTCNAKEQRHAQKCSSRMINIDLGEQFGNGMIFRPHVLQQTFTTFINHTSGIATSIFQKLCGPFVKTLIGQIWSKTARERTPVINTGIQNSSHIHRAPGRTVLPMQ